MVRYPHTAILSTIESKSYDSNGNPQNVVKTINLQCRVELDVGAKNEDIKGMVFLPIHAKEYLIDSSTLEFQGVKYKVVKGINYQSHTELWVE